METTTKKYELIESDRPGMYFVKALRDFGNVKAGDIGGYVAGERNLSHEGNCWVGDNAYVHGNARVCGNARVFENAKVFGNARVYGGACVYETAAVFENARVFGIARMHGGARVRGNARVFDSARVYGNAEVHGAVSESAWVYGNARVDEGAIVAGDTEVYGTDRVTAKNMHNTPRYTVYLGSTYERNPTMQRPIKLLLVSLFLSILLLFLPLVLLLGNIAKADVPANTIDLTGAAAVYVVGPIEDLTPQAHAVAAAPAGSIVAVILNSPGGRVDALIPFLSAAKVATARGAQLICVAGEQVISAAFDLLIQLPCTRRILHRESRLLFHEVAVIFPPGYPLGASLLADVAQTLKNDNVTSLQHIESLTGMPHDVALAAQGEEKMWSATELLAASPLYWADIVDFITGIDDAFMGPAPSPGFTFPGGF